MKLSSRKSLKYKSFRDPARYNMDISPPRPFISGRDSIDDLREVVYKITRRYIIEKSDPDEFFKQMLKIIPEKYKLDERYWFPEYKRHFKYEEEDY